MNRRFAVGSLALMLVCFSIGFAAIPNQSPENLRKNSTHIVVGKVKALYKDVEKTATWLNTKGVVEIAIEHVEKGDRLAAGDAVYARFWQQEFIGKGLPPPHGAGHYPPEVKQHVRVFLKASEGGYEALLPNGFEQVTDVENAKTPKATRYESSKPSSK